MYGSYVGGVIVKLLPLFLNDWFLFCPDFAINYEKVNWGEVIRMVPERRNRVPFNSFTITPSFFWNSLCHSTKVGKLRNGDTY